MSFKSVFKHENILFYLLATLYMSLMLAWFIIGTPLAESTNLTGWFYFLTSCITHASIVTLAIFLVFFLPLQLFNCRRTSIIVTDVALSAAFLFLGIDMQVFKLYRMHLNKMILDMVFGPGATEIFTFNAFLYVKEILVFLVFVFFVVMLWPLAKKLARWCNKQTFIASFSLIVFTWLSSSGMHIYGDFFRTPGIVKTTPLLPYYYPLEATHLLMKMGFRQPKEYVSAKLKTNGETNYPLKPLNYGKAEKPNILFIMVDSWNKRSLTPECMPNSYRVASEGQWYDNHFSCSNRTRPSVFGIFFGVSPIYWDSFDTDHKCPLLFDAMRHNGYEMTIHCSACLLNPPLGRVVFSSIPGVQMKTPGNTVYDRDCRITSDFIKELPALRKSGKPFFSLLFYDLAHSFEFPKDKPKKFMPSWDYADYSALGNDTDPTEFFNLYRNCCYEIDQLIGKVLAALKKEGLDKNTIIILTGDHGQEFNENHKNYWGHNGNFSKYQVGIPFIMKIPGEKPHRYTYRTTHYDIAPTLMHNYLGVKNPTPEYSDGYLLGDKRSRKWHVVGGDLVYAFLVDKDIIITKQSDGGMDITTNALDPIRNYKMNYREMNQAFKRMNRFFK